MPYTVNDESLPENVKKMPEADRKVWVGAWNGAHKSCMAKDGADSKQCETSAFAIANAAVKKEKGIKSEYGECVTDFAQSPISFGAISFEELDQIKQANEQADKLGEVSYQTETLVSNVMRNPEISDKPSALSKIVDGLKKRLSSLMKSKKEVEPTSSYFTLTKDKSGDYRWFSLVTNHFRDADNPPEIFETKAHREFVEYIDNGGEYPELWLWHTPGTKCGVSDWVDFDHGFLMASGTFDKDKLGVAEKLSKDKNLGVSHGYYFHYSRKDKSIIDWYRTFEISPLPSSAAANPYTGIEIIKQEATKNMNANKRKFLVDKLGEDRVKELESLPAEMEKSLKGLGVEYKEANEHPVVNSKEIPFPDDPYLAAGDRVIGIKQISEAAVKAFIESEAFKTINNALTESKTKSETLEIAVTEISKALKELQKTDDEKIAMAIAPKSQASTLKRASESKDNLVDPEGDEELTGSKAAPSWLGSALGGLSK